MPKGYLVSCRGTERIITYDAAALLLAPFAQAMDFDGMVSKRVFLGVGDPADGSEGFVVVYFVQSAAFIANDQHMTAAILGVFA